MGKGNYKGTLIKTFTIKPADISKYQAGISASSMEYNGAYRKPTVTVKNGETVLKKDRDYAVMYTNNKNLGTANEAAAKARASEIIGMDIDEMISKNIIWTRGGNGVVQ